MCPASPSTYRSFYVHLERIVPSTSAVQHARAVYAALPRSSLRLSTAPALLSSDGKSSSIRVWGTAKYRGTAAFILAFAVLNLSIFVGEVYLYRYLRDEENGYGTDFTLCGRRGSR